MVAKLIVWGPTREIAIERMLRALAEFEIDGVPTTAKFHEAVLRHPIFREGTMNTGFIEQQAEYFKQAFGSVPETYTEHGALLAALLASEDQGRSASSSAKSQSSDHDEPVSLWRARGRINATTRGGV